MKKNINLYLIINTFLSVLMCTQVNSQTVTGVGTNDFVTKWTNASLHVIGDSQIQDDGTNVGIGLSPSASYKLDMAGSINIPYTSDYGINGHTFLTEAGISTHLFFKETY